ncbi:TRAP transporter large permease [Sphaerochaeta globosa]|uniref:TRAP dicarboxylate transporter, DctM subunit n=1 Tax=Sphaerochaeta globosa (strain ATCC BAA-1886 / DSM 22777 / Buddy) TaxID=158189 RepID=F0RT34_SPHGB|nr:TRAP transporter large permease [Sphaerochaeta globosa]ADY14480.1 TRAP dicarboxylate transporter, DctM subunit [Sphaerochaeta globosa str. Buddy]
MIVVVLILIVTMFLGVPIAFSLAGASIVGFLISGTSLMVLGQQLTMGIAKYSLLPLPFFIFSGYLMGQGGISRRLIKVVQAYTGHRTGGVAMVTIISCMIFAAVSGSSSATTAAIGSILIPAMLERKYDRAFAGSVTAVSAELGMIIPPSISMIIYGVITETSIAKLFMAGFLPGIFIGITLIIVSYVLCRKKGYSGSEKASKEEKHNALKDSWLALLMPVVVLGGIYTGIFTATESSVVAVVYAIIVGTFVYKEISWEKFKKSAIDTLTTSGMIMMVIACATAFSFLLTREQIPQNVAIAFSTIAPNSAVFLILTILLLTLTGMFFDSTSAVTVLAGILTPVAIAFGINPIHFGVIMIVNMAIGCVTPPVGVNLFVACKLGDIQMEKMFKELIPFWIVILLDLIVIAFVPQLSLFLPSLMH